MRIAFIGLGNMGGPMAMNLLRAGHRLRVHDIRRNMAEPHLVGGAQWADTPADAAQDAELVLTSLPGPREVEAVALGGENGIIHGIRAGAVYADLSTNSPTLIRRMHELFAVRGVSLLDAPVSGGIPGARSGTLSIMVGGDEATYLKIKPALEAIGDKLQYVGAIGSGAVAKIVHNMLVFTTFAIFAEAFTLGVKAGVDPEKLYTAVRDGAYGQNMMLAMLPARVFPGHFDHPSATLAIGHKDIHLAAELARELNVPAKVLANVEQNLIEALAHGLAEQDFSVAFTVQEDRAGVKLRT